VTADSLVGPALGIGWAVVVAAGASGRLRRGARRRPVPVAAVAHPRPSSSQAGRRTPVVALGAAIRQLVGAPASPARSSQPPGQGRTEAPRRARRDSPGPVAFRAPEAGATEAGPTEADRRTGWAALVGGGLLVVAPALAAAPVAWAVAVPVLAARRDRARHEAALHDQLPDVVDLLALTAAAGLPVSAALVAIDDRPGGPLGAALARASAHVRHGGSTADALATLGTVGPAARPLVDALVQHDRYGTPLLPALERVAIEARSRRRRRAEEAARRLPVTLLFPLVLTTFPAFVLLTVVPLLAGSLGSLSLSPT
jgi:Flp pilus assembly protein TadB